MKEVHSEKSSLHQSLLLAERNYLGKKKRTSVKGILKQFPNIGMVIEEFVRENNVGGDACRRTGVLTFDSNC